jgi:hypothetical protein
MARLSASGTVETYIAAGHRSPRLGSPTTRGAVFVSPNGRFAGSYLCRNGSCETQVVDLASRDVFRPTSGRPGFLRTLTDTDVVLTDGDHEWIAALDARSGHERWRVTDSILMTPLAGRDGSVLGLTGSIVRGWAVARIDRAGRSTDVTPRGKHRTLPQVWTQLSTPRTAVVGADDFLTALSNADGATADLVDVERARVVGRGVVILPGSR